MHEGWQCDSRLRALDRNSEDLPSLKKQACEATVEYRADRSSIALNSSSSSDTGRIPSAPVGRHHFDWGAALTELERMLKA